MLTSASVTATQGCGQPSQAVLSMARNTGLISSGGLWTGLRATCEGKLGDCQV